MDNPYSRASLFASQSTEAPEEAPMPHDVAVYHVKVEDGAVYTGWLKR